MTESFDAAYYADLESRVKEVIRSVQSSFPPDQIAQLFELAEHNEPGVAVRCCGVLVERPDAPVHSRSSMR